MQKIKELISVLDQRKDESIERTFKGVARNFQDAFSDLVQGGHGYLVMMKKTVSIYFILYLFDWVFFFPIKLKSENNEFTKYCAFLPQPS